MSVATRTLHAEWTKVRTVSSSGWLLVGIATLTLGLGVLVAASVRFAECAPPGGECLVDPTRVALSGVYAGQVAAVLSVAGSLLVGRVVLPVNGFTPANGYPALSPTDPATLRASVGTVLYLGLIALLSLGVALVVRHSGAAIATTLGLLFVFPLIAALVTEPRWREWLTEWAPMSAGLAVQATRGLDAAPVGPWQGLGVLAAYAVAALVLGGVALEVRDA